jgi:hypothetical protein
MRFLTGKRALSIVEYILGGALVLAIAGLAVFGVISSVSDQGDATETSINSMPAQPTW